MHDAIERLASDVNGLLARGLQRVLAIAVDAYERLLGEHALLDFAGMLARSVALLARQEEFARSRLKLQARYHHLLIDEFTGYEPPAMATRRIAHRCVGRG